jgi:hypothetical protein
MSRNTTIINISAEPEFAKLLADQAKKSKKSQSQLLREAFESYMFEEDLLEIQKVGRIFAEKHGLESYDDIEKFFG